MSVSTGSADFQVPSGLPDIVTLGIQMWGEPTRRTPGKVEFGSRLSKCVEPAPVNRWFDHEADHGGGYLDLYKLKFGKLPDLPGFPIPPGMAKELGNPVRWWDYEAENGQTIARVVRFHPPGRDKEYRQCRPDGPTWRWKMLGLQIPLYHLPELMQAPTGSTVCIAEGEQCVDQIRAWGALSTTNAGGAKKFRPYHAAVLASFDCVIIPDNDDAGRAHAIVVADALRAAGCDSIRVVNLPNLPPKGDVIDWVRAGGTAEAFAEMVATAPAFPETTTLADGAPAVQSHAETDLDGPPPEITDPGYHEAVASSLAPDPVATVVAQMNSRYMVVKEAGRAIIYEPTHDEILNRRYHERITFEDLRKLYLNQRVRLPDGEGKTVRKPVADVWLHHPDRRQYIGGVIFDPSGRRARPDALNLWQGFAVKPKAGSWSLMQRHIFEVICRSIQELYDYVLNWLARLMQFPAQQGEVAIVMKGEEGVGKGILARAVHYILGQHALHIINSQHLVGNFNAHLRDAIFLFADEAFFAGDKAHVGVLKGLITEPVLTIEAKYQNAVQAPNFLHVIMASNEEWVVPAGLEARRFLVLLVAATYARQHKYFAAIQNEMDNGGHEAMLHDLLHRDLSSFNVRDCPHTAGLDEQKKLSLGTSEAWWLDVLHRGYVYRSKIGLEHHFGAWRDVETTEVLFASYVEFAKAKNERHPMARETFGRFMVKMGGEYTQPRNAVTGEHLIDVPSGPYGDKRRTAELIEKARATGYNIGSLETARKAFRNATKLSVEWESTSDEPPPA